MTDTAPAIALLFDDSELGGHLREALHERGARIVHEGEVSGLSRELLQRIGADVLVVNLDDSADDALDQLYELLDGDRPRVVFNDAQASHALAGWDRARWARHLAVKVLAAGDIDPPRPENAREIDAPSPAIDFAHADTIEDPAATTHAAPDASTQGGSMQADIEADAAEAAEPVDDLEADPDAGMPLDALAPVGSNVAGESEDLAAELEALLAAGNLPDEAEETSGPGLRYTGGEEPPPLHDGHFGAPEAASGEDSASNEAAASGATTPTFNIDHLQLSALTDPAVATEPATAAEPTLPDPPAQVHAPEGWALLDEDTPADSAERPGAAAFGIEKVSAAEFLAPDVAPVAPDVEPTMSLQLVSLEEAVAPQAYVPEHEMLLDDNGSALSRIVLLGAAHDGVASVCAFLEALPPATRLTFLLAQHPGGESDAALVERFAARCALPIRLADARRRAVSGEVVLVPAGQQVRLHRDGGMDLHTAGAEGAPEPSIDATLTMAANAFGRDALAIVFAGPGNDAVAGAQAIHDRGGQVWVESSSGEHFTDMVSGIFAERLVSYSGTPAELAARLIEVYP